ncbi:MAG: MBL fold metallo-hydrolase [Firmicutes bacterium]|nr:MBL fold metallo-hydrolase [Bacillota bacterium]
MTHLAGFERPLSGNTMLRVHVIYGDRYALMVDTAMRGYEALVQEALELVKKLDVPLAFIVNTHAHHDHIGLNRWVQQRTGARLAAHEAGCRWIEDADVNYREFVLGFPQLVSDSPALRREVRETLGEPGKVDLGLSGGERFHLGGVDVETVDVSGHMFGELALLVQQERTLVLGDALIGLDMPMFHGYVSARRYRKTLNTLRDLVMTGRVTRVVSAHLPPLEGEAAILAAIEARAAHVDRIEAFLLDVTAFAPRTLKDIWTMLSEAMGKEPEFRGLTMIANHLHELCDQGRMKLHQGLYQRVFESS